MKYKIEIEKDHADVAIHYDLSAPVGGAELIATFQVWIDGAETIHESASGNTRFFGTVHTHLKDESQDVDVSFELTSNQGFEATDSDKLRGGHPFDEASFSN